MTQAGMSAHASAQKRLSRNVTGLRDILERAALTASHNTLSQPSPAFSNRYFLFGYPQGLGYNDAFSI